MFKSITIRIFKHKLYCLQYLQVFSSASLSSSKSFNQSLSKISPFLMMIKYMFKVFELPAFKQLMGKK